MKDKPRKHTFAEDLSMRDPLTKAQWCLCGLPFVNDVHNLPDAPGQREHRRRAGESEHE